LAQVKQVHKLGQQYNGIKLVLNRLFKQAITAGKRVRTETSIGTGAVSISSAAVELAQMKGQNLAAARGNHRCGKMSRLLVQHLLAKGAVQISILNRSPTGGRIGESVPGNSTATLCDFGNDGSDGKVGFGLYQYCGNRAVN